MTKAIPKAERCSEQDVSDSSGWHFSQCSRRGTITEEDKLWCFQHAPSAIRKRRAESAARYEADMERHMAPSRERKRLLGALQRILNESHDPNIERIAHDAIEESR